LFPGRPKDLGVNLLLGPCAQDNVQKQRDKQRPLMDDVHDMPKRIGAVDGRNLDAIWAQWMVAIWAVDAQLWF